MEKFDYKDLNNSDLIYIADTYGVYENEFLGDNKEGNFSKPIYGGMSEEEINLISSNLKNKKKLIVEFNSFGTPTSNKVRKKISDIF